MLAWGAEWLSEISKTSAVQTVQVTTGNVTATLDATLCDEAGRLLPGQTGVKTEHTKFLFETADVANAGITFIRGTTIVWNDSTYKVVADGNRFWTYNDAFKRKIAVSTKHVSLSDS